jgi:hypothetical protein
LPGFKNLGIYPEYVTPPGTSQYLSTLRRRRAKLFI